MVVVVVVVDVFVVLVLVDKCDVALDVGVCVRVNAAPISRAPSARVSM